MFEQLQKKMGKVYRQLLPSEKSKYGQVVGSSSKSQVNKTCTGGSSTGVWREVQMCCFPEKAFEALTKLTDESNTTVWLWIIYS